MSAANKEEQGHNVGKDNVYSEELTDPEILAFRQYQSEVPKLSQPEITRMIVQMNKYGVLSTVCVQEDIVGFPVGSSVQYAVDGRGRPIFCISSLSSHTKDLQRNHQASLQVQPPFFKDLSDSRVSIMGNVNRLSGEEASLAKEEFLKLHPKAFWVHFGDFAVYKMERVIKARLVGGFGVIGWIEGEDYESASTDPVCEFSEPVCKHMNEDHNESIIQMVRYFAGINVQSATMQSIDRLGTMIVCERNGQSFKCRLGFPKPVTSRQQLRDVIVTMSKESAAKQPSEVQQ